mgnify:CR=1 FL=1
MPKIDAGNPSARVISSRDPSADCYFTYSFRVWRERPYFEIGDCTSVWFNALLSRLHDFSNIKINKFLENPDFKRRERFHEINWDAKKIPVAKDDFRDINEWYENQEEFPFYQFQLSKANGRVIGYFDVDYTFNIVALDPNHNFQPSSKVGYHVITSGRTAVFPYESMRISFDTFSVNVESSCGEHCSAVRTLLQKYRENTNPENGIMLFLDVDYVENFKRILQEKELESIEDLLIYAIDVIDRQSKK